jgi:predicted HTH domain antitoxin
MSLRDTRAMPNYCSTAFGPRDMICRMQLTVDLPNDFEAILRRTVEGDLNAYAREALAVQLYRDRKISHGQFQRLLGISSYEADTILKRHGGVDDLTAEELAAQVEVSAASRKKH